MDLTMTALRGLLAVVVGILAVAWPGIAVGAFVLLFAFYAGLTRPGAPQRRNDLE